jgi:hypothetical protein
MSSGSDPRVFCIGLNKTGTSSLAQALEILGYRTLHDDFVARRAIEKEAARGLKILSTLNQYRAFADIPFDSLFRELDEAYPGSRFVLTTRDPRDWLRSREQHVKRNRRSLRYRGDALRIDRTRWLEVWKAHHEAVLAWFEGRPADLLVMDIPAGDGFEELCAFLEKPLPGTAFPHLNPGRSRGETARFRVLLALGLQFIRATWHRLLRRSSLFDGPWRSGHPVTTLGSEEI